MDLFSIVPLIVVVVLGLILFQATKSFAEWSNNNSLPVQTVPARVVAKRAATNGSVSANSGGSVSTTYYATFELDSGHRLEFPQDGKGYGLLVEGDVGDLTYQGTRYHGFRRQFVPGP